MAEHKGVILKAEPKGETITFPPIDIVDGDYYFFPFNMKLKEDVILKSALATPLCVLNNDEKAFAFYTDKEPSYKIQGDTDSIRIITLSREEAKNAWKIRLDAEHLIICKDYVLQEDNTLLLYGKGSLHFKAFPDLPHTPEGFIKTGMDGGFGVYEKQCDSYGPEISFRLINETPEHVKTYEVKLDKLDMKSNDVFLHIEYEGDMAKLYLGDEFIADDFYTGMGWDIGLKRFGFPDSLKLVIYPLKEDAEVYLEKWPDMEDGIACNLTEVLAVHEYRAKVIA